MANDSSIIDIDSLALETVTGGMPVPPPGGSYGGSGSAQPPPKPPAGGSLTASGVHLSCPAGTAPYYETVSGTATAGVGPFHIGQHVTERVYGCAKVK
jgi:hypothetical protein